MTQGSNTTEGAGGAPVTELSYTEASRELDEIVAFFEQREVDVDLLVARLQRATAIVDELDRRLRRTRAQVEELVPRLESATALQEERPSQTDTGRRAGRDAKIDQGEVRGVVRQERHIEEGPTRAGEERRSGDPEDRSDRNPGLF